MNLGSLRRSPLRFARLRVGACCACGVMFWIGGGCSQKMPPLNPPAIAGFGPPIPNDYNLPRPVQVDTFVAPQLIANPAHLPIVDRDVAFDQIIDVLDDYFKIEREDRVRQVGDLWTEGTIETFPTTGAMLFELQLGDSVGFYERLESTLQTIRRRAIVKIAPEPQSYGVEVIVFKELEDLKRPSNSTAGAAMLNLSESFDRRTEAEPVLGRQVGDDPRPVANPRTTVGWIPLGRDPLLEQRILGQIAARLNETNAGLQSGRLLPNTGPGNFFAPPAMDAPGLISPDGNTTVPGMPGPNANIGLPPSER